MKNILLLIYCFLLFFSLIISPKFPEIITGIRVHRAAGFGRILANRIYKKPGILVDADYEKKYDDLGIVALLGLSYALNPSYIDVTENRLPPVFFWLMEIIYIFMMLLLYGTLQKLWGSWFAFLFGSYWCLSPVFRFTAFSMDVYLFPIYAAILFLKAFLLLPQPGKKIYLALIIIGIFLCEFMRSSSILVGLGFAVIAIYPKIYSKLNISVFKNVKNFSLLRKRAATCFLLLLLLMVFYKVGGRTGHPVWHSLHAGLMEFGGHIDKNYTIYPYFVPTSNIPEGSESRTSWSDQIEIDFVKSKNPDLAFLSKAYADVLRNDYLRIATHYPLGLMKMIVKRFWLISNLDIWSWNPNKQQMPENNWLSFCSRLSGLLIILTGFFLGEAWTLTFLSSSLALSLLPPMLVYASSFVYNLPGQFALSLMLFLCMRAIAKKIPKLVN